MENKMTKLMLTGLVLVATGLTAEAQVVSQKVGDNPTIIDPNAALEIQSTNKGFLLPRVSLQDLTGSNYAPFASSPTEGMQVFNTNDTDHTLGVYTYIDGTWVPGTGVSENIYSANGKLAGDRVVNQDGKTLRFNDNAADTTPILFLDGVNDRVGFGTATPSATLDVSGIANVSDDFIVDTNSLFVDASANSVGVGTITPKSSLEVVGSFGASTINVNAATTLNATHNIVRVTTGSTNDVTITLPAAADAPGRIYTIIKDDTGSKKIQFNLDIVGSGFTIVNVGTDPTAGINVPGEYRIQSDATNWKLIK